jgi:hypothetical protein
VAQCSGDFNRRRKYNTLTINNLCKQALKPPLH